jgi:hypothetical protein
MARRLATLSATDSGAKDRLSTLASATDPQSQAGYEVNAVRLEVDGDRDAAHDMIQQGLARYPDSENLRYEYIQPWLTRLARGTATKEVTVQAAKLTHSADAVVRGTVLASQQRWAELRDLDGLLAEATWRDPWKLAAIMLQVQWRCEEEVASSVRLQRGDPTRNCALCAASSKCARGASYRRCSGVHLGIWSRTIRRRRSRPRAASRDAPGAAATVE